MQLTPEQVKGRIKNVAKENKADARTLMRIYMMERFLERVANSRYKDNFIIKGGMLVTAMVGVALRSTMDIDTSIKNQNLSAEDARRIVDEIKDIDLGDGVTFEVKEVSNIMDEMEYPGIRFTMNVVMGKLVTPMKIDISTGDVITPRAIDYKYKLLLDERSISLWSYNLETILADKKSTIYCSRWAPEEWLGKLDDGPLADAILDRIRNSSYTILLKGRSLREDYSKIK